MLKNMFPKFEKGRILKIEMLENLRDYPRDLVDIKYKNYSDGIITGAELVVNKKDITVQRGIIKFKDKLYVLKKEIIVPYNCISKEQVLKVKFTEEIPKNDFTINDAEIFIDENVYLQSNEIELGRFKLHKNAVLRSKYTDFYDFSTEYNTINIINSLYAGLEIETINPAILNFFSQALFKTNINNIHDVSFAMQCNKENHIDRKLIINYISNRLGISNKYYSNSEIYNFLCEILREAEGGNSQRNDGRMGRKSRIIVD
jgi:hypothetical protein